MSELSPQRRKVAVLAASVACMSAAVTALTRRYPHLTLVFLAFIMVALVYTIAEFMKLKRSES